MTAVARRPSVHPIQGDELRALRRECRLRPSPSSASADHRSRRPAPPGCRMSSRDRILAAVRSRARTMPEGARSGSLAAFLEPSLALLTDKPPHGPQWLQDFKFDGHRIQAPHRRRRRTPSDAEGTLTGQSHGRTAAPLSRSLARRRSFMMSGFSLSTPRHSQRRPAADRKSRPMRRMARSAPRSAGVSAGEPRLDTEDDDLMQPKGAVEPGLEVGLGGPRRLRSLVGSDRPGAVGK